MNRLLLPLTASCLALTFLGACESMIFTGARETAMAVAEDRPISTVVDDATIYASLNHYFLQADVRDLFPNVNISVKNARVLLTGNVDHAETKDRATTEAWRAEGVQEVINEIEVVPGGRIWNRAQDEWVEKNLEGRLTITKGVNILNYSVEVVNAKVYLLGTVSSEQELDAVLQVARTAKGVSQVISHLRSPSFQQPAQPSQGF